MSNAGQTCVGIERVYATEKVYDDFRMRQLTDKAARLPAPGGPSSPYGPITMPARSKSSSVTSRTTRGRGGGHSPEDTWQASMSSPRCWSMCPRTARRCARDFGPTITVARVKDTEEACGPHQRHVVRSHRRRVHHVQGYRHGPGPAHALRHDEHQQRHRLASVPSLPFGGVGGSGFGRIHGDDGLREITRAKSVTRQRFALPVALTSLSRPEQAANYLAAKQGCKSIHGRQGWHRRTPASSRRIRVTEALLQATLLDEGGRLPALILSPLHGERSR